MNNRAYITLSIKQNIFKAITRTFLSHLYSQKYPLSSVNTCKFLLCLVLIYFHNPNVSMINLEYINCQQRDALGTIFIIGFLINLKTIKGMLKSWLRPWEMKVLVARSQPIQCSCAQWDFKSRSFDHVWSPNWRNYCGFLTLSQNPCVTKVISFVPQTLWCHQPPHWQTLDSPRTPLLMSSGRGRSPASLVGTLLQLQPSM